MANRESDNLDLKSQQLDRLFDLFLACREMDTDARGAWLREKCEGDATLQMSVERMILADASVDGFLSHSAGLVARAFTFVISEGERFGRYTITGFIGRGGMGEVWKAHDEELDRAVALKFMQSGFAASQLTQEARMASALNHPGIVTVHDVFVWQGTPILVMELVQGKPLSLFCQGSMPLDQLLKVAIQTSSALAAAHAEGIIHGDLKPDNIIWREDHFAKILDFGLARKVTGTALDTLAGTPLYMSPEQARGEAPGTASDVYSLGLVLFELASGQRPFGRQTLEEIAARQTKPAAVSTNRRVPDALQHLIGRMLEPDVVRRISMREVSDLLGRIERKAGQGQVWRSAVIGVFFIVLAALALLSVYRPAISNWLLDSSARVNLSRMTVRPLASQPGFEDKPSLSPDGLWISCLYRAQPTDVPQLQIHSTRDARPVVIEIGRLVPQGPAAWSPDSTELAFSAKEGPNKYAIYRVARTGGPVKRIHGCRSRTDSGCELDWSPDGKTLAVADRFPGNSELYVLDLMTGYRRDLIALDNLYVTTPRFSPDSKWVAYLKQPSMTAFELIIVPAGGGVQRRITENPPQQRGFVWSPDGSGLLAFSFRNGTRSQMWKFSPEGKAQYMVGELDSGRAADLVISRRKGSLAWVRDLSVNSLSRMSADQPAKPPERLLSSAAVDLDGEWSRNGRMVFRSDRSGASELWIANDDGSNPWQATRFRGVFVGDPHWAPDGARIAFTAHSGGNADIFVMRCEPGTTSCDKPRQLTRSPEPDANPTWSADGRWIYFSSSRSGGYEVWRMPSGGPAEPERLTWNGGYLARESTDGKWLYFSKLWNLPGFWRIALPARGAGQIEIPVALNVPFKAGATWALGSKELFYYPSVDESTVPFPDIRAVNLTTGATRNLPVEKFRLGRGLSLSPDEHSLLRSQTDRAQTLIMVAEQGR